MNICLCGMPDVGVSRRSLTQQATQSAAAEDCFIVQLPVATMNCLGTMLNEVEISRSLRAMQARHTYFLLTATAGGIALAIIQIHGLSPAWFDTALGLTIAVWGVSFYFGCRYVDCVLSELYLNIEGLEVASGGYHGIGDNPALVTLAESRIRRAMRGNSEKMSCFGAWQFRLLVGGAFLYAIWLAMAACLKQG
jgi:hypothetical protein